MYKIIGTDQKEYGPVSSEQLIRWIAQGRVNAQTRAQAEGGVWKTLGEFPEFAPALGRPVPASPIVSQSPAYIPTPASAAPKVIFATVTPPNSGLAIASLVLGILGIFSCGLSAIVGLILGIMAMSRVRKSNGTLGGHGLALAGTIISAVFLLLIPLVGVAMILPAVAQAKQRAQTIECLTHMAHLSQAVRGYAALHDNHFPAAATWNESLERYLSSQTDYKCPMGNQTDRCHYAFNSQLDGVDRAIANRNTVLFFEIEGGWDVSGGRELLLKQPRHGRLFVVAFADGHTEQVSPERLATLRWNP